ncbi:zinc finger protein ZFPM2 [Platysternon megacephalum]|uniref:Zinc finger protein ZFPM2 n=1 Tax=Platysternon megacephalum TaxID=55544 RepID=A0A4D9EV00_9SAUR|nr:zinc finger protein ZFPM2 [Platysternon megacephalum]
MSFLDLEINDSAQFGSKSSFSPQRPGGRKESPEGTHLPSMIYSVLSVPCGQLNSSLCGDGAWGEILPCTEGQAVGPSVGLNYCIDVVLVLRTGLKATHSAGSDSHRTPSGSTHSNAFSESRSSLGSERGGGPSATESCQNDLLAEECDSDASRSAPGKRRIHPSPWC